MKNSSKKEQFAELQAAIVVYSGLIEEIKGSEYIKSILKNEPWLKTAINKWESSQQATIDEAKIYKVSESFTDKQQVMYEAKEFLMKKLEIYLAEYRLKKAQFNFKRTISNIQEAIYSASGNAVEAGEFYLGGLFVGEKDTFKTKALYKELINYTLAIMGYKQKHVNMEMMGDMFYAPLVKEYIDDIEEEAKRLPEASLHQLIESIIRKKDVAEQISKDSQIAKPIRHFARMVVDMQYYNLDCDNQDFNV